MAQVRIFQVGYDPSLLQVRAEMLKHVGFEVSSGLGNTEAQRMLTGNSNFDLIVVGWSASDSVRREMVGWIKQHNPELRVITLYRAANHPIPEADFNSCSEYPEEWFNAVKRACAGA